MNNSDKEKVKIKGNTVEKDNIETEQIEEYESKCIYKISSKKSTDIEALDRRKKYEDFKKKIVEANINWANSKIQANPNYFSYLSKPQTPKYLVFSCSDSRVVLNELSVTEPGEIFSHRNVGNLFVSTDINANSVLQYAVEYLNVEHIIVIGHTDCGAIKASLTSDSYGLLNFWLKSIKEVADKHKDELKSVRNQGGNTTNTLIRLNVQEQCLNVCKSPIVQKAWSEGRTLLVHGYVFDISTGLLNYVEVGDTIPDIYKYEFPKTEQQSK